MPKPAGALALCLAIEERPDRPMDAGEVKRHLDLLADERWVDEPEDRRWSDWTGPIEPVRQMQVRGTAMWALRKWGGELAAREVARRIEEGAAGSPDDRARTIGDAAELLGIAHPVFVDLLQHHKDEAVRGAALQAVRKRGEFEMRQQIHLFAPLLADADEQIVRQALDLLQEATTGVPVLPGSAGDLFDQMCGWVTKSGGSALRDEAWTVAAIVCGRWTELAAKVRNEMGEEERLRLVRWLNSRTLSHLLGSGDVREALRPAVFARFRAARPGWRFHDLPMVCCFAPDEDALALGLEELALRAGAGMEMAAFVKADAALGPRILATAIGAVPRESSLQQMDAFGLKSLFEADSCCFAEFVAKEPAARLHWFEKAWKRLPDSREADRLMNSLRSALERLEQKEQR